MRDGPIGPLVSVRAAGSGLAKAEDTDRPATVKLGLLEPGAPLPQCGDLALVNVEPDHLVPDLRHRRGVRSAEVAPGTF